MRSTAAVLSLIAIVLPLGALAQPVQVTFHWSPPRTGAEVDHYNIYQILDGGLPSLVATNPDTIHTLMVQRGVATQLAVSGVSRLGQEGLLSEPSDVVFFDLQQSGGQLPVAPLLRPNYPNPFNPETTIVYGIPSSAAGEARVALDIFDMRGHRVRRLPAANTAGWHQVRWDGTDETGTARSSGQYLVRLSCGDDVSTWKMTMVK